MAYRIWFVISFLLVKKKNDKNLKLIWLHFVRTYISVGMFFYFRRIKIYDVKNVPKNKPVLLLSNHQNALLDALLIATKCGRLSYFLTLGLMIGAFISAILNPFCWFLISSS